MKKKLVIFIIIIVVLAVLGVGGYFGYQYYVEYNTAAVPKVTSVSTNEEHLVTIKFEVDKEKKYHDVYCLYKNDEETPKVDDKKWVKIENNECSFTLDDNVYYAFLKNQDNIIYKVDNVSSLGEVTKFEPNKNKIYLALNTSYTPTLSIESVGNIDKKVTWKSENDSIAKVDENGKITALKKGDVKVTATLADKTITFDVVSTNLIIKRPKKFNNKKSYLPCNKYSEAENDLLDAILLDRVTEVGYKTRASAVEAARFLALEFPYKIRYFSENGRLATNKVDGEGRYYHKGLYLHSSRFDKISKSLNGPKTWGCQMWSNPSKGMRANGLDCSGFISWAMLNGGWDVKDVGAGLASHLDLTDYGKRTKFNKTVVDSGKVKVGDLLSGRTAEGGHIAMIVGEDDDYYYVAESLWIPPNVAVVILPYKKYEIYKTFYWVMLMDDYYKKDGKLTKMWY